MKKVEELEKVLQILEGAISCQRNYREIFTKAGAEMLMVESNTRMEVLIYVRAALNGNTASLERLRDVQTMIATRKQLENKKDK